MMQTIAELSQQLAAGDITSVALTEHYLARITQHNSTLNAFLAVHAEQALAQAKTADARRAKKSGVTKLTGLPLSIKDVMHVHGMATTCASKMLAGFQPTYSATVVQRLIDAGAVILGKTNMDEFAMGASTENSAFGATANPWDVQRVPGGSSGGSAAAVAAGLCAGTLGSDTGGSIRQPAAFCGIAGLKPTYGRVSRYGLVAFASSLDQIGPMAWTVEDCALLLQCIAGHDPADSTSLEAPVPDYTAELQSGVRGLTIGIPDEYFGEGIATDVADTVHAAIATLEKLGAKTKAVHLPHTKYAVPTYYVIAPAEASSNLARYDGVRFGHRSSPSTSLTDMYEHTRCEGFGPEVTRRIMVGTYVLSSGYYDAYYRKAQQVRALIAQDFQNVFREVDVLCTPTAPHVAFRRGEKMDDPVQMYLADICTSPCNLAGLPGMSIPCGLSREQMPIGLQIVGKPLDEATVLRTAHAYEQATEWHMQRPHGF